MAYTLYGKGNEVISLAEKRKIVLEAILKEKPQEAYCKGNEPQWQDT